MDEPIGYLAFAYGHYSEMTHAGDCIGFFRRVIDAQTAIKERILTSAEISRGHIARIDNNGLTIILIAQTDIIWADPLIPE